MIEIQQKLLNSLHYGLDDIFNEYRSFEHTATIKNYFSENSRCNDYSKTSIFLLSNIVNSIYYNENPSLTNEYKTIKLVRNYLSNDAYVSKPDGLVYCTEDNKDFRTLVFAIRNQLFENAVYELLDGDYEPAVYVYIIELIYPLLVHKNFLESITKEEFDYVFSSTFDKIIDVKQKNPEVMHILNAFLAAFSYYSVYYAGNNKLLNQSQILEMFDSCMQMKGKLYRSREFSIYSRDNKLDKQRPFLLSDFQQLKFGIELTRNPDNKQRLFAIARKFITPKYNRHKDFLQKLVEQVPDIYPVMSEELHRNLLPMNFRNVAYFDACIAIENRLKPTLDKCSLVPFAHQIPPSPQAYNITRHGKFYVINIGSRINHEYYHCKSLAAFFLNLGLQKFPENCAEFFVDASGYIPYDQMYPSGYFHKLENELEIPESFIPIEKYVFGEFKKSFTSHHVSRIIFKLRSDFSDNEKTFFVKKLHQVVEDYLYSGQILCYDYEVPPDELQSRFSMISHQTRASNLKNNLQAATGDKGINKNHTPSKLKKI